MPAPEVHPIPAEVSECSRSADVLAAAEDALTEEEIVRKLAGIDMELSQEELRANDQMQQDEVICCFLFSLSLFHTRGCSCSSVDGKA